jgi:hypothetical protein
MNLPGDFMHDGALAVSANRPVRQTSCDQASCEKSAARPGENYRAIV